MVRYTSLRVLPVCFLELSLPQRAQMLAALPQEAKVQDEGVRPPLPELPPFHVPVALLIPHMLVLGLTCTSAR